MNPMNPKPLSHLTCAVCGTRIEWGRLFKDASRHYCRDGGCECVGREWYALRRAGEWTHHFFDDERGAGGVNYVPLQHRTCDVCCARVGWRPIHTDAGHHYRDGRCSCPGREWSTRGRGTQWTDPSYRDGGAP
jgi:hypothetical protein